MLSSSKNFCRVEDHLIFRAAVHNIMEKLMQEVFPKLEDRVINITEQTVVDALETCDEVQNKALIKNALRSALYRFIVFILGKASGIKESFEVATF